MDAAGNSYIVGYVNVSAIIGDAGVGWRNADMFLAKYDTNGNRQWVKQIGSDGYDYAYGITIAADGNLLITGETSGTIAGASQGGKDVYVGMYAPNSNLIWDVQFGGDSGYGILQNQAGDIFVAGNSGSDTVLYRLDSAGAVVWQETVDSGGSDYVSGRPIAFDAVGNLLLAGRTNGSLFAPNAGDYDTFITKYDIDGNQLWGQQSGSDKIDQVYAIDTDSDSNAYITGFTYGDLAGQVGAYDIFIRKYMPDGNYLWTRQIGTTTHDYGGNDILIDPSGDAYVAGSTGGTLGAASFGSVDILLMRIYVGGCP